MAVRALVSIIGTCAALVMCAVSAAMNYLFLSSLGKSVLEGQVLGAASAAADVLKALLPFFIAWSWQARRFVAVLVGSLAFAFIAGFSLLSAIGFAADNRGFLTDQRENVRAAYARVQSDLKARGREHAGLPQVRPPSVVEPEIERFRQNRRWSTSKFCADATELESREYCAGYFALKAELAAGQEAVRLSSEIAALLAQAEQLRQQGSGPESDPQATLVSRISGLSEEPVRLALIVAVALLVEIGASLGLFLASGHRQEGAPLDKAPPQAQTFNLGSVEDYCLEALVPSKTAILTPHHLHRGYRQWCAGSGRMPLHADVFESVFAELAATVGISSTQGGWRGIALKHDKAALDMVS